MGKMKKCKACGKEISKDADKCPNCGKDQRNFFMRHKIITAILAILIIAVIGSAVGKKNNVGKSPAPSSGTNKETAPVSKVNYDNFVKINMGTKYSDVTALLGQGKEQSSSEIAGIKTIMYNWNGPGLSNMNVTVQNGIVTGKAQIGLKNVNNNITLNKYNQAKEGMTYSEVKAILGEGQIVSQTKVLDMQSTMYEWMNKDGSNANLTFSGDKLQMKAQFNLK